MNMLGVPSVACKPYFNHRRFRFELSDLSSPILTGRTTISQAIGNSSMIMNIDVQVGSSDECF